MSQNPIRKGICPASHSRKDLPGWLDGVLATHCGPLEAYAKAHDLSLPKWTDCKLVKGKQLGCGAYGCVFDTKDRDTVFKLTADETEAHFIGCYRQLQAIQGWRLDGMAHYRDIVALRGVKVEILSTLPLMQVYAVWREAADCVGEWDHAGGRMRVKGMLPGVSFGDWYDEQGRVSRLIMRFKSHAELVREQFVARYGPKFETAGYWEIVPKALELAETEKFDAMLYGGRENMNDPDTLPISGQDVPREIILTDIEEQVGFFLRGCILCARHLTRYELGRPIGQTLLSLYYSGLLLADVHLGNVGVRYGDIAPIITDPGHLVLLDRTWKSVSIEAI